MADLRPEVKALIKGIGFIDRRGHTGNIAAVHFDGPWLDECLRLAREIEAVNIRNIPPKVS